MTKTDSGEVVFRLRDGAESRVDFCEPMLNLLAHAQAIELDIGSRCGGHGVCGGDRVLTSHRPGEPGLSRITEAEKLHLTEAELNQGMRLACQCFPEPGTSLVAVQLS